MKRYVKAPSLDPRLFEGDPEVELETVSEWVGMPTFHNEDKTPFRQIIMSFESQEDVDEFCRRLEISITDKTKSTFFPPQELARVADIFWFGDEE